MQQTIPLHTTLYKSIVEMQSKAQTTNIHETILTNTGFTVLHEKHNLFHLHSMSSNFATVATLSLQQTAAASIGKVLTMQIKHIYLKMMRASLFTAACAMPHQGATQLTTLHLDRISSALPVLSIYPILSGVVDCTQQHAHECSMRLSMLLASATVTQRGGSENSTQQLQRQGAKGCEEHTKALSPCIAVSSSVANCSQQYGLLGSYSWQPSH